MIQSKIRWYVSAAAGLAAALFVLLWWDPERLLKGQEEAVSMQAIEADPMGSFQGKKAGYDVPRLTGKDEFEALSPNAYVTAEPLETISTGVDCLNSWADPYVKRKSGKRMGRTGRQKSKVKSSGIDLWKDYSQYYLIRLPDQGYILALLNRSDARTLLKGGSITLPIGQKAGLTPAAKSRLTDICTQYDASMEGVLTTLDEGWFEKHKTLYFLVRFGTATVVFFGFTLLVSWLGEKLIFRKKEGQ